MILLLLRWALSTKVENLISAWLCSAHPTTTTFSYLPDYLRATREAGKLKRA